MARLRHAPAFRGKTGLRVNAGCGRNQILDGWINLDVIHDKRIVYWDVTKSLPFDTGSVDFIFSEHVFEHLEHPSETMSFLSECRRCLSPGGVLRIIVPDAGLYMRLYAADDWQGMARARPLIPSPVGFFDPALRVHHRTNMEFINSVFRQFGEHKYAYDKETLLQVLQAAGFSHVEEKAYGISLVPGAPPDTAYRQHESIYMEARN